MEAVEQVVGQIPETFAATSARWAPLRRAWCRRGPRPETRGLSPPRPRLARPFPICRLLRLPQRLSRCRIDEVSNTSLVACSWLANSRIASRSPITSARSPTSRGRTPRSRGTPSSRCRSRSTGVAWGALGLGFGAARNLRSRRAGVPDRPRRPVRRRARAAPSPRGEQRLAPARRARVADLERLHAFAGTLGGDHAAQVVDGVIDIGVGGDVGTSRPRSGCRRRTAPASAGSRVGIRRARLGGN